MEIQFQILRIWLLLGFGSNQSFFSKSSAAPAFTPHFPSHRNGNAFSNKSIKARLWKVQSQPSPHPWLFLLAWFQTFSYTSIECLTIRSTHCFSFTSYPRHCQLLYTTLISPAWRALICPCITDINCNDDRAESWYRFINPFCPPTMSLLTNLLDGIGPFDRFYYVPCLVPLYFPDSCHANVSNTRLIVEGFYCDDKRADARVGRQWRSERIRISARTFWNSSPNHL